MSQVNKLVDALLSTAEMTDEECKAELEAAGVDVAAAEKRMDAKFKNMLDSLKPGPAADKPEPPPTPGGHPVAAGVIEDMQKRVQFGLTKYGTMLHTHNGRDALMDAYQEALDLCMYLKQAIMERDS